MPLFEEPTWLRRFRQQGSAAVADPGGTVRSFADRNLPGSVARTVGSAVDFAERPTSIPDPFSAGGMYNLTARAHNFYQRNLGDPALVAPFEAHTPANTLSVGGLATMAGPSAAKGLVRGGKAVFGAGKVAPAVGAVNAAATAPSVGDRATAAYTQAKNWADLAGYGGAAAATRARNLAGQPSARPVASAPPAQPPTPAAPAVSTTLPSQPSVPASGTAVTHPARPLSTATTIPTRSTLPGSPSAVSVNGPLANPQVNGHPFNPSRPLMFKGGAAVLRYRATLGDAYSRMVKEAQPPKSPLEFDPELFKNQPGLPGNPPATPPINTPTSPPAVPFKAGLGAVGGGGIGALPVPRPAATTISGSPYFGPSFSTPKATGGPDAMAADNLPPASVTQLWNPGPDRKLPGLWDTLRGVRDDVASGLRRVGDDVASAWRGDPIMTAPTAAGRISPHDPRAAEMGSHFAKPPTARDDQPLPMNTYGTPSVRDAVLSIGGGALAGAALPVIPGGPTAGRVALEAGTGVGALRNAALGTWNLGKGLFGGGRAAAGEGAMQLGLKAPLYGAATAGVGSVNQALQNPGQTPYQPGAVPETGRAFNAMTATYPTRVAEPFARAFRSLTDPLDWRAGLPGYLADTTTGTGKLLQTVADETPAALRAVGNHLTDVWHDTSRLFGASNSATEFDALRGRYQGLVNEYRTGTGAFAGLDDATKLDVFNAEASKLQDAAGKLNANSINNPAGYGRAYEKLLHDESIKRLIGAGRLDPTQADALRQRWGTLDPTGGTEGGVPLYTARDMEMANARIGRGGLENPIVRAGRGVIFDKAVQARMDASGLPMPAAPEPRQLGTEVDVPIEGPAIASQPQLQPQPAQPTTPTVPGQQPQPQIDLPGATPEQVTAAGNKAGALIAAGGGLAGALASVEGAPPPPGFGTYWRDLPSGSKFLAIAGLSIAAITALRGMFGGDDEEDEPSFLMKVLPFLGLGAAAWGLGGGTVGFSEENLPQMKHYKALGNAVTSNLGMGSLLN